MAKTKSAKDTPPDTGKTTRRGLSRKVKILAGGAVVFALASGAGSTYLLASTPPQAAEAAPKDEGIPVPMPVAGIAKASASDYQIVSIFEDEAIVATRNNLVRLKVGSSAPGIGVVTDIQAGANGGGTVVGTDATLRSL